MQCGRIRHCTINVSPGIFSACMTLQIGFEAPKYVLIVQIIHQSLIRETRPECSPSTDHNNVIQDR